MRAFAGVCVLILCSSVAGCHCHRTAGGSAEEKPGTPPPEGHVDLDPFVRAGCERHDHGLDCTGVKAIVDLGCDPLLRIEDEMFALTPSLPILVCASESRRGGPALPPGIRMSGCMEPVSIRYVAWKDGAFVLMSNESDFTRAFAPVDTPGEAVAFVAAIRGAEVRREVRPDKEERAIVDGVAPSFAEPDGDGFRVRLFESVVCGCSRHPTSAVDYRVTRTGTITELSRRNVLERTSEVCVD